MHGWIIYNKVNNKISIHADFKLKLAVFNEQNIGLSHYESWENVFKKREM